MSTRTLRAKKTYDKYKRNRTVRNYYDWKKVEGEERIKMSPNEIAIFISSTKILQTYRPLQPRNKYFGPDHANIMKQMN